MWTSDVSNTVSIRQSIVDILGEGARPSRRRTGWWTDIMAGRLSDGNASGRLALLGISRVSGTGKALSMKKIRMGMSERTRKVGDRGQVTIPKDLRERHGIEGGDEVVFVEVGDEIRIKPPTDEDRLAEGYRKRAQRSRHLAEEMEAASAEATQRLGEAPDWSE
jgi:AbrB family looped-hinge helix DNA binding protein